MASFTIPSTIDQLRELARQLSPQERKALLDSLLAERFDVVLSDSNRRRGSQGPLTDEQIQAEVDVIREQRREDRQRAPGS